MFLIVSEKIMRSYSDGKKHVPKRKLDDIILKILL